MNLKYDIEQKNKVQKYYSVVPFTQISKIVLSKNSYIGA